MSVETRAILKGYFQSGSTPTETHFGNLIDSTLLVGDIIDNFTSTSSVLPLSAASGKALNDLIAAIDTRVDVLEDAENTFAADYYKKTKVDELFAGTSSSFSSTIGTTNTAVTALATRVTTAESAITAKAASSHVHAIANVTGLQSALDLKATIAYVQSTAAGLTTAMNALDHHTDQSSNVTALQSALTALTSVVDDLPTTSDLNAKAAASHTHTIAQITDLAASYYTKSQVDTLLSSVTPEAHTHTESEITNLDKYTQAQADLKISDHGNLTTNPHSVSKAQVGLGSVENKSVSEIFTSSEATAFATGIPGQIAQAAHEADTANPHGVSKTQVGLSSVPNVDVQALLNTHIADSNPHSIDISFFDVYSRAEVDTRVNFHLDARIYDFTPTSGTDPAGTKGDLAFDSDSLYIKTSGISWVTVGKEYTDTQVAAEAADRAAAISSAVIAEASARSAADTTLQTNIGAEATTRASADTTLQANIDFNDNARILYNIQQDSDLSAEVAARLAADAVLSASINVAVNGLEGQINTHIAEANPHTVTASDVGAYTISQVDTAFASLPTPLTSYNQLSGLPDLSIYALASHGLHGGGSGGSGGGASNPITDSLYILAPTGNYAVGANLAALYADDPSTAGDQEYWEIAAVSSVELGIVIDVAAGSANPYLKWDDTQSRWEAFDGTNIIPIFEPYTKSAVDQLIVDAKNYTDTHENDQSNPHAVTAAQVGAYTTTLADAAITTAIGNITFPVTQADLANYVTTTTYNSVTHGGSSGGSAIGQNVITNPSTGGGYALYGTGTGNDLYADDPGVAGDQEYWLMTSTADPESGLVINLGGNVASSPRVFFDTASLLWNASDGTTTFVLGAAGQAYDGDIDDLDIDGATDIGAPLVDTDLFIVDDGAGGTNRKSAASRIKAYIDASAYSA